MQKSTLLPLLVYAATNAVTIRASEAPSVCMLSPLATAAAGDLITASISNPQGGLCEANLIFADQQFLPVNFVFRPITCLGFEQANISIPMEVPNGVATIIWECSGDGAQSCSRLSIEGGSGDSNALVTQQSGTVECLVPIATFTTLATLVVSSSTSLEAVVSTEFSTSTMSTPSMSATFTPSPVEATVQSTSTSLSTTSSTPPAQAMVQLASTSTSTPSSTTSSSILSSSSVTGTTSSSMSPSSISFSVVKNDAASECSCSTTTSQSPTITNNGSPFN